MLKALRQFLTPTPATPAVATACVTGRADGPTASASSASSEPAAAEHAEWSHSFCHRPGENFVAGVRAAGGDRLLQWFQPEASTAEARAVIRLLLAMIHAGEDVWDQPGLSLFAQGWRQRPAAERQTTAQALSVLAQWWAFPIKLFYEGRPGEPMMVDTFDP